LKTVLALGNPGDRYRDTRHNVGWWFADRLRTAWSLPPFRAGALVQQTRGTRGGEAVRILKPLTYMNRSGQVLEALADDNGPDPIRDLIVAVDDVWLEPGEFRFRRQGSSGGHNGLESVEQALDSQEYSRLRIGVGRPRDSRIDLAAWVLAPLMPADEEAVIAAFDEMVKGTECWVAEGISAAMDRFNRRGKREG
jgi:PTH1 family peptidyl-tRNA hydrolase